MVGASRTIFHYKPKSNELNEKLKIRLKELADKHRRYGHHRLYILLRREGIMVNHKRTERIYKQEGLMLQMRRRKKLASVTRIELPKPTKPNQHWAMDFMQAALWNGRRFKAFPIVDVFSKECPVIEVDTSLTGQRVVWVLERLAESRGIPQAITVDNGPEFISKVLDEWAYRHGVKLDFIRPGKPVENAYVESFNGKFRDECLNQNYFLNLSEAKETIENWRIKYNTFRPHSSLNDLTPQEFLNRYFLTTKTTERLYLPVA